MSFISMKFTNWILYARIYFETCRPLRLPKLYAPEKHNHNELDICDVMVN